MAQVQVSDRSFSENDTIQVIACDEQNKRKVNLCLGQQRYVTVFKNDLDETVINIRKGTRSVTISKNFFSQICDIKETILLCCSFTEKNEQS